MTLQKIELIEALTNFLGIVFCYQIMKLYEQ